MGDDEDWQIPVFGDNGKPCQWINRTNVKTLVDKYVMLKGANTEITSPAHMTYWNDSGTPLALVTAVTDESNIECHWLTRHESNAKRGFGFWFRSRRKFFSTGSTEDATIGRDLGLELMHNGGWFDEDEKSVVLEAVVDSQE